MCGIAGILNTSDIGRDNREDMMQMRNRMLHRGPDGGGTWVSPDGLCTLGHQRLSILDLSLMGSQPMGSHSGRTVMVFNGEIYNYAEVKKQLLHDMALQGQHLLFRSTCDTEVLLEAAEFYGLRKALTMCRGMFALGIYNVKERTLTLARDRIGEKPLYYGWITTQRDAASQETRFVFASDVGSIRAIPGFCNTVEERVLNIYMEYGVIPAPYSIYKGIYKLEPGTILSLSAPFLQEQIQKETYWSVTDVAVKGQQNLFQGTRKDAADELERLLKRSIREQMISDVPLGAFLSAGIDSPTIVSLMQEESPNTVKTFTIGMKEQGYNEAEYAREIAEHLGTDHTEFYISEEDAKAVIPLLPRMFSEPFADSSQIPTYLVSSLTRKKVTVSLSGDAGDELFCGYYDYPSTARKWGKIKGIPYPVRSAAGKVIEKSSVAKRNDLVRIKSRILQAKSPEEVYRFSFETDPVVREISLCKDTLPYAYTMTGEDVTGEVCHDVMLLQLRMYHPDDILVKVDRTAMAVSLETRVPFLDRDVVEFAWTLPVSYLRDEDMGKLVLRDVLYRRVPEELVNRPKKGFSIPIRKWLKEKELRSWAEELLRKDKIQSQGFFNPDTVETIWNDFIENDVWRDQIWYILMFEAWFEEEYSPASYFLG